MTLLIVSFLAGALTILAPCILPMLPVIIGGSLARSQGGIKRPLIITLSLIISIVSFSLLLKASTLLLAIPTSIWQLISGGIIILFGISFIFPRIWEELMVVTNLQSKSNQLLGKSNKQKGVMTDIFLGFALGPVFSSCSPTFALIIAAILPASFSQGLLYLGAYAVGLGATLLLVVLVGQATIRRFGWALNPEGWFHKALGLLFILVGIALIFGFDKQLQTYILDQGWYDPITQIENSLRR